MLGIGVLTLLSKLILAYILPILIFAKFRAIFRKMFLLIIIKMGAIDKIFVH